MLTFVLSVRLKDKDIMNYSTKEIIQGWFVLSRPPFHTVGVLPFILGTYLAFKFNSTFSTPIFVLGVSAVILIMLSTYHAGEYFDYREDEISQRFYKNKFAGGTGIMPAGRMPRSVPFFTSIVSFLAAGIIGLLLQFYFKTGPWTLLLGCLGALPGFFYSTRPVRLVERGCGELFIGFCYGWLPVASAYYIQTAAIIPIINWLAIPIGLTIFNVILLNEFPDYEADKATGKRNLLNRLGKKKGGVLYAALSLLSSCAILVSPLLGLPCKIVYIYLPVLLLSLFIVVMVLQGKHENRKMLERLCGLNIAVNLGTSLTFILVYI